MKQGWHQKEIDELLRDLAEIKNREQIESFLERIVTPRELNDIAIRLKIWKLLEEGESYSSIQSSFGVGTELISKVSNKIGYGFRRTSGAAVKREKKFKNKRRHIRYKGAPSILELLD
jgi:TrpR-related protein YerC/YecD